ncbi:hypothetical protein N0V93_000315 [Gnomoniopsis smithogilvyi]|uniref:VWFA domain-containing protein n=1 Tax=Gnomoniopsis smithogilvyi TaxID=1191159 RepID=A0A9W8Z1P2_9PEZI|nr:hypothetical protein N0V93_000315 [Gnomoniopsis smithogilvyi]
MAVSKRQSLLNSGPAAPPAYSESSPGHHHQNAVIAAAEIRAQDEQEMQQLLQVVQLHYRIYNTDLEPPEHDVDFYCTCQSCAYRRRKAVRYRVQDIWSKAVMYPGEKAYNDNTATLGWRNPYRFGVVSPYGPYASYGGGSASFGQFSTGVWAGMRPIPKCHTKAIQQTIQLNNSLNQRAQSDVDAREPSKSIWGDKAGDKATTMPSTHEKETKGAVEAAPSRMSKFSRAKELLHIKSAEQKATEEARILQDSILAEELGRWPDEDWRAIVSMYQEKMGMTGKIAHLRTHRPIQYLHLLRAGYFEPIPVAWADRASNPLKFTVDAAAGWRGITPSWRGFEDTAEERLYWVLNHREGTSGPVMKPDFISAMNMARARMASAVEPPPAYFSEADVCRQYKSDGYSKQVMPAPFQAFDRPETANDDTMILLDVSGSMDFKPLIAQPDVAKAIIRRFIDAMSNHAHNPGVGYDLATFSNHAKYIGIVNHHNFDERWRTLSIGGGTRVMTGWQLVKNLHFQKHSASATHHPVYGWQAGPETPMLRLLLLLDGEAQDMDEFELDLLGLSWAHVTIFLIGVDGCPHHHRHANELQRISDVNHHVSFVDAQGNCPERFVTHELLKRHLGYNVSLQEFEELEELPAYTEAVA